jgi:hypothetical protein
VNTPLFNLLTELLNDRDSNNPAFNYLLNDYAKYHFVMVILGGISFISLAIFSGYQMRLITKNASFIANLKTIRGKAALYLSTLTGFLALSLVLIVIGNLGNALNPRPGFKSSLGMLGNPPSGTKKALLQQSYADWIESESASIPRTVSRIVDDRISWQMPKALICLVLLALFIYLCKLVWAPILRGAEAHIYQLFALGVFLSVICGLLLIMAIANAQGSIAPVSLSLFFS